jgi:hypothetical protein
VVSAPKPKGTRIGPGPLLVDDLPPAAVRSYRYSDFTPLQVVSSVGIGISVEPIFT